MGDLVTRPYDIDIYLLSHTDESSTPTDDILTHTDEMTMLLYHTDVV